MFVCVSVGGVVVYACSGVIYDHGGSFVCTQQTHSTAPIISHNRLAHADSTTAPELLIDLRSARVPNCLCTLHAHPADPFPAYTPFVFPSGDPLNPNVTDPPVGRRGPS